MAWVPPLTEVPTATAVTRIGSLVRDARRHRGLTQQQLADRLGTSQSAIARIEQGGQNLTLELLGRLSTALDSELINLGPTGPTHLRVEGGRPLRGSVVVKSSKNAAVALLCGALLNRGRTTLRNVARIVEVERILDVLRSIGVSATWDASGHDLTLVVPDDLDLAGIDADAARRTRSIIMFLGPLLHRTTTFQLPYAGGCDLGTRTVQPHMIALRPFGLEIEARAGEYHATVQHSGAPARAIVLTERGTPSPRTRCWPPPAPTGRRPSATPAPTTWSRTSACTCSCSAWASRAWARRPSWCTAGPCSTRTSTTRSARTRSRR